MDEFKGTPGPWASLMIFCTETQECTFSVANREFLETQEDGPVVALISPEKKVNEIDIANANLISSAPDLLKSAADLLAICKEFPKTGNTAFDLLVEHSIPQTEIAIAKALGKEVQP